MDRACNRRMLQLATRRCPVHERRPVTSPRTVDTYDRVQVVSSLRISRALALTICVITVIADLEEQESDSRHVICSMYAIISPAHHFSRPQTIPNHTAILYDGTSSSITREVMFFACNNLNVNNVNKPGGPRRQTQRWVSSNLFLQHDSLLIVLTAVKMWYLPSESLA
jgi:hypothetical protein